MAPDWRTVRATDNYDAPLGADARITVAVDDCDCRGMLYRLEITSNGRRQCTAWSATTATV